MTSLKKIASTIPKVPLNVIEKMASKISPNFNDSFKLCQRVLKNSLSLSGDQLKIFSIMLALKSTYKIKDYKNETKMNLIKITASVRKQTGDKEVGILKQLIYVAVATAGVAGAGYALLVILVVLLQSAMAI